MYESDPVRLLFFLNEIQIKAQDFYLKKGKIWKNIPGDWQIYLEKRSVSI